MNFPNNHPYKDIGMYLVLSNDKSYNCQTLDLTTVDLHLVLINLFAYFVILCHRIPNWRLIYS